MVAGQLVFLLALIILVVVLGGLDEVYVLWWHLKSTYGIYKNSEYFRTNRKVSTL